MKESKMNSKTIALFIVLGVSFFIIFLYLVFNALSSFSFSRPETEVIEHEEQEPEKILEILNLAKKGSHSGRFFSFTFDENEGISYFYIDPGNEIEGNLEFDQFLKQNGIPDRSHFPGLEEVDFPVPTPF